MSVIEIFAALMGVLSVWLTIRQHILCWPTGLVMVALYIWIFFDAKLYSDAALQVVYVVLCSYGWYHWARGGPRESGLLVTGLAKIRFVGWIIGGLLASLALGYVMSTRTDASFPYLDAITTVLSLIAQFLMTRKKLESWIFWISVDVLAIGIYAAKGLHVTALLYGLFLVLAVLGLRAWMIDLKSRGGSSSGSSCPRTEGIGSSAGSPSSSVTT
ncbi:MAG: nicotinamide mononucleotide transporter [Phycisphaerales bacterium]|nr:nicotinamide mononucleotide transporter [Phycisphaerales bacterium]